MNNKQLAKELLKVTRYGYLENQLEALEKLLNEHRPEQLHKPDVSGSCCSLCGKPSNGNALCEEHESDFQNSNYR